MLSKVWKNKVIEVVIDAEFILKGVSMSYAPYGEWKNLLVASLGYTEPQQMYMCIIYLQITNLLFSK